MSRMLQPGNSWFATLLALLAGLIGGTLDHRVTYAIFWDRYPMRQPGVGDFRLRAHAFYFSRTHLITTTTERHQGELYERYGPDR
jgi:hypothetical protein